MATLSPFMVPHEPGCAQPLGSYSPLASAAFLEGFASGAHVGGEMTDHLHLTFVADGSEHSVGVYLTWGSAKSPYTNKVTNYAEYGRQARW